MEHLSPAWQLLGHDRHCFPRKEVCGKFLSSRVEMVSVGVITEPCHARWEVETDQVVLQRRQKQIDYGKCTLGYQCFLQQVPRKASKNSLRPVDSTPLDDPLDDWLQAPESSENWDRGQKEAQFAYLKGPVSSSPELKEEEPHH
ncbi:hypothetical protein U0070_013357 [Myodes glareolus]|uniref:Histone RNA hairpin-binding protein RNA-binding domain-containing protein n=1 Tax=Myodes glareolus TaxID=447135 RepID=A0AAW0JUA9_MYOGA